MNDTPKSGRLHIAIFGRRNAGKSSLINALTNQNLALVSDVPGTTTDPVSKAMEILPIGPVLLIDTAGIDDHGYLGEMRVAKTLEVLAKTDLAILVAEARQSLPGLKISLDEYESNLVARCREKQVPIVIAINKIDLVLEDDLPNQQEIMVDDEVIPVVAVSALCGTGLERLKILLVERAPQDWAPPTIAGDLVRPGERVVLVTPIDASAPKGRMILPQVQVLRDLLDHDTVVTFVKEDRLQEALETGLPPALVITDSQVFGLVNELTPETIALTSFSILFARYKGDLEALVKGALAIDKLRPGAKVLIAEACTHHRTSDDIGKVKIPRWLTERVGGSLDFRWASGLNLPPDIGSFQLIVHCGACMINRREMLSRLMVAQAAGVPIVNYGVAIAYLHGILPRVLSPFESLRSLLLQAESLDHKGEQSGESPVRSERKRPAKDG